MNISADKRQLRLTAHTAGTLKSKITVSTVSEVKHYPFGTEHCFRFFLPFQHLRRTASVKYSVEVNIENDILQIH